MVPGRLVVVEDDLAVELLDSLVQRGLDLVQPRHEALDLLGDRVEVEARARRRGDAEARHQRIRASFYLYSIPEEIDRLIAGLAQGQGVARLMSEFEQLYREVILDHYKAPRNHGLLEPHDAIAEGQNPLCGDEVTVSVRFGEGDVDRGRRLRGPGLRDQPGGDVDAHRPRQGPDRRRRSRRCRRTSSSTRSGSRSRPVRLKCALLGLGVLKVALHRAKGTPLPEEWGTSAGEITLS